MLGKGRGCGGYGGRGEVLYCTVGLSGVLRLSIF